MNCKRHAVTDIVTSRMATDVLPRYALWEWKKKITWEEEAKKAIVPARGRICAICGQNAGVRS
jgi:hypothetical protein